MNCFLHACYRDKHEQNHRPMLHEVCKDRSLCKNIFIDKFWVTIATLDCRVLS